MRLRDKDGLEGVSYRWSKSLPGLILDCDYINQKRAEDAIYKSKSLPGLILDSATTLAGFPIPASVKNSAARTDTGLGRLTLAGAEALPELSPQALTVFKRLLQG